MGKALPGYDTKVVDPESAVEVDPGEVGELVVSSHDRRVFFDAYWNRPDATAEKEIDDGWFRTGDLVRIDADGYHWFVARTDDIILTRGYRVGPMEVESAILDHPHVEQVGVIGVPDDRHGEAIAAYIRPTEPPGDPDALREDIRDLVRERLAAYEYPEHIWFVDALPTTASGKIKRSTLRERM